MKKELNPLYFLHERIWKNSFKGFITKEQLIVVLRMHHNIPKDECSLWIKGMEELGLIKIDGVYYKVSPPIKSREETIHEFKQKFGLL